MLMARSGPAVYPCCTVLIIEVNNSNSHWCSMMLLIIQLSTDSLSLRAGELSRWLVVQALRPVATSATSGLVGSMFSQTGVLTYGLWAGSQVTVEQQRLWGEEQRGERSHLEKARRRWRRILTNERSRERILTNERSREVAEWALLATSWEVAAPIGGTGGSSYTGLFFLPTMPTMIYLICPTLPLPPPPLPPLHTTIASCDRNCHSRGPRLIFLESRDCKFRPCAKCVKGCYWPAMGPCHCYTQGEAKCLHVALLFVVPCSNMLEIHRTCIILRHIRRWFEAVFAIAILQSHAQGGPKSSFGAKNGQTWLACRCPKVVYDPKWSNTATFLTIWGHFWPIWTLLDHFRQNLILCSKSHWPKSTFF